MTNQIAIIGSPTAILGFKALGVKAFPVSTVQEGEQALVKIQQEQYAILIITEDWAEQLPGLEAVKSQTMPAVVVLPPPSGGQGYGERELSSIVEKAVGSDILSKN